MDPKSSMMFMMAEAMPEEHMLEILKKHLDEYMLTKDEELREKIEMDVTLLSVKYAMKGKKVEDVMEDMDKIEKAKNIFKAGNEPTN